MQDSRNNVIYIDKEKRQFDFIRTYQDLNAYIDENRANDKHNFILIDEIQDIEEFERSIRSYRTEPDTDIIVTGSNAKMFSGELATLIGGRYKSIYIQFGGMPGLARIGLDEEDVREYQADILNTVLLKDVIMRNQIRNVPFLQNLVRFLADNTGKIISANGIAKYMKSQGESVTFMESGFLKAMTNIILKTMAYAMHYLEERGKEISKRLLKILFVRNLYGVVIHCM